jgi:uncharacterized UPF0146 family protein
MNNVNLIFHINTSQDIKNKTLSLADKMKRALMVTGLMEIDAVKMVEDFYKQAYDEGIKQNNQTDWNKEPT